MSPLLIAAIIALAIFYGWAAKKACQQLNEGLGYALVTAVIIGLLWFPVLVIAGSIYGMWRVGKRLFCKKTEE